MASSGSFNTNAYGSGNYYRYLVFSWSVQSQSTANNTTTISWTLKGAGGNTTSYQMSGNFKVVVDGSVRYETGQNDRIQLKNGTLVASGTYTMTHDSTGNRSFSASVEGAINTYARNVSGSSSWTLPSITRAATITSAPNFNDTANPTIQYSNPAGNSVTSLEACISLTGSTDNIAYRDIPKTGTSYTFNLTEAERNVLRAATPNSNTLSVKFYIRTIIGGTTLRDNVTKTMTIVNANPTFSASYKDTKSATTAITGNNQKIIRNQSTLQVSATSLSAKKYATISSVACTLNGVNYSGTISGTTCTFNIGTVNLSSNAQATVKVTDSRGNTATNNLNITILDWVLPTAITTMERENNFYSNTSITVDGSMSSVDNLNSMTIKLRYKKTTTSTWSSYTTMQDNVAQTFNLDNNYAWDVQVVISDLFGSTTYNLTLSRGMPIIFFDRMRSSTGFNCFPQQDMSVEVNGVPVLRSVMSRSLSDNLSSLQVNTYTIIPLDLSTSYGSAFTATSDGGIKIGAGVTKVLLSGRVAFQAAGTSAIRHARIIKNSYSANNTLIWDNISIQANYRGSIIMTPLLVSVQQNDVIYLTYYTGNSADSIDGNSYGGRTSLTIESVG